MNINLLLKKTALLSLSTLMLNVVNAQEAVVVSQKGQADVKKEVNFMQIALLEAYNKQAPKPIQFIGNRKAREIPEMDIDPTGKVVKLDPFSNSSTTNRISSGVASPGPVQNFNGLNDNGVSIPPDVNGAVGPNHIMVTLNTQVRIMDRNGVAISTTTLNNFWSPIGGLTSTYDPKVLYDHFENRWIFVSSAEPQTNNSCTLLAVSKTSDPTQGWNMYKVDVDPTNTKWVDYPSLGFNDRWIVVQMNLFPMPNQSASSHQIYVWDKQDVYNNGTGVFTKFDVTNEATAIVCPSIHYDKSVSQMFLMRVSSGNSSGKGTLTMRTLSGTATAPVLSNPTIIQTNNIWGSSGANNTNFAPQLGITNLIATNDHRMRHVVVRNGRVWAVHSVFLPASFPTRSSVQWWEFDTVGNVIQRSMIDDPTGARFFSFPSIAINNKNDALLGYASFSADQYASASYSFRTSTDPINTFRDEYIFKYGENTYIKDFGGTRVRWGDYTNTVIDPTNDSVFWTIQEYAGSTANNWATWWAKVDPYTNIVDFAADNNYVCPGEPVAFTNKTNFNGSNIEWTFTGGTPATSTDPNPIVKWNTAGKHKVTLKVDGITQTKESYVVVLALPIRTILKSSVVPCTSLTLRASQSSGTYLWSNGATTQSISVNTPGEYYCDIIAPNGVCSQRSDSLLITFQPPVVTLDSIMPVNPSKPAFTLTGGLPKGGTYSGQGVANGKFDPAVTGEGVFPITYTFVSHEGCGTGTATRYITVSNSVGINSELKITSFKIAPNPSKGNVEVSLNASSNSSVTIQIIDQLGRIVWTKSYDEKVSKFKQTLDLSSLPKGSYFLKANFGDASDVKKLILD